LSRWCPRAGRSVDLDALLVDNADKFFGGRAKGLKKDLMSIKTAKSFPENSEIGLEGPGPDGVLRTWHYSISLIPENKEYKPRVADERIGYFTTSFADYGKFRENETSVRYINRWNLQKADATLKLSPPKQPLVFYIEHTTPIRYRRWVREGILMWNKAFERVGLIDAIEVRQQDAATKAHMEKDPGRRPLQLRALAQQWSGPSHRTQPRRSQYWPNSRCRRDPGRRLDPALLVSVQRSDRQYRTGRLFPGNAGLAPSESKLGSPGPARRAGRSGRYVTATRHRSPPCSGRARAGGCDAQLLGEHEYSGLTNRFSQKNGLCMAANCKSHGMAMLEMLRAAELTEAAPARLPPHPQIQRTPKPAKKKAEEEKKKAEQAEQMIDGIPESFVGPLLADLVAHEVGHTLGLRHNFKASSVYTVEEINSARLKGNRPFTGSVMDYIPVNINVATGEYSRGLRHDRRRSSMTFRRSSSAIPRKRISSRFWPARRNRSSSLAPMRYWGPDPRCPPLRLRQEPARLCANQMRLVMKNRAAILDKFVKDGDSWARARRGYELTLQAQVGAVTMMANWIGGTFVYRDKKGEPNGRTPLEPVPAQAQREALEFVVRNTFDEASYGLTPDLLRHLTIDKWWDSAGQESTIMENPAWPVHDAVPRDSSRRPDLPDAPGDPGTDL